MLRQTEAALPMVASLLLLGFPAVKLLQVVCARVLGRALVDGHKELQGFGHRAWLWRLKENSQQEMANVMQH